jgi:hypothetical protein
MMRDLSDLRVEVPISKSLLRALLENIDGELETAESSIVQNLPGGGAKTWLLNNQAIGRRMIERVEQKRREVL